MESKITYKVFESDPNHICTVDTGLLDNITYENKELVTEMMASGHYVGGIFLPKFLREDLSINLEKLELAVSLAVMALEANSEEDVTLYLRGLDEYYRVRGIAGMENREREERTFLLGFISSVASEASVRDTLVVKYIS